MTGTERDLTAIEAERRRVRETYLRPPSERPGTLIRLSFRSPSTSTWGSISSRATTPGSNTTGAPASRYA